jgi:hypothetical protein
MLRLQEIDASIRSQPDIFPFCDIGLRGQVAPAVFAGCTLRLRLSSLCTRRVLGEGSFETMYRFFFKGLVSDLIVAQAFATSDTRPIVHVINLRGIKIGVIHLRGLQEVHTSIWPQPYTLPLCDIGLRGQVPPAIFCEVHFLAGALVVAY